MITFYSGADLAREKRKRNISLGVCAAAALAGLSACLWLLFTAGTLSAEKNELTVYAVNALCGAFVILVYMNAAAPAGRTLSHFSAVAAGETEAFAYTEPLFVSETPERVPGGVKIYRVTAVNGSETRRFFLYAPYLKALQGAGTCGTLLAANGYITGVTPQTGGGDA